MNSIDLDLLLRSSFLEAEDLVLHLADSPGLVVSKLIEVLLAGIDHRRWSTHENLVSLFRTRQVLLDGLLGYESSVTTPSLGRVIEEVVDSESIRVVSSQSVQFILEQNVFLSDIGVDEIDLSLVLRVLQGSSDDLKTRSESGTTSNHTNLVGQFRSVVHLTLGALDLDELANLELVNVLGDVSIGVRLDDQVEEASVIVGRSGSVGSLDILAIDVGLEGDVLTNGQAENTVALRQTESVEGSVTRDPLPLHQVVPLPFLWVETGLGTWGVRS